MRQMWWRFNRSRYDIVFIIWWKLTWHKRVSFNAFSKLVIRYIMAKRVIFFILWLINIVDLGKLQAFKIAKLQLSRIRQIWHQSLGLHYYVSLCCSCCYLIIKIQGHFFPPNFIKSSPLTISNCTKYNFAKITKHQKGSVLSLPRLLSISWAACQKFKEYELN